MLVLACGIRRDSGKSFQLHDIDQLAIARPVTKAQFLITHGSDLYTTVRYACQLARSAPAGPVIVEVPVDLYLFKHEENLELPKAPAAPVIAKPPEIEMAAQILNGSRKPLLYLGLGAAGAGADLVALAERLEAPVATTFQGKGIFPENHPLWLWCGFGEAAPSFVRKIAADCDATLAIGCRFSEVGTGSYGLQPPGKLIHVDIDPGVLNKNYPALLGVISDGGAFVSSLLPRLKTKDSSSELRRSISAGHAEVWTGWEAAARSERVSPALLIRTLQSVLGPNAIFTTDSGNGTFLAIECLRLERPRSFLAPIDYSCMGYAVPSALGAALACPDRPVAALAGDGAFLMTGLELLTASSNKLPAMILVLRDRELAQISQFQKTALGKKACSELPDYYLSAICRGV
jgi:acetolactate synthase-1/2/3 large subunit